MFGFRSCAAEDAYQAGLSSGRAHGIIVASFLSTTWGLVFAASGTVDVPGSFGEIRFPVFLCIYLASIVPFAIAFTQAWRPVQNRGLVYATSNIMVLIVDMVMTPPKYNVCRRTHDSTPFCFKNMRTK